MWNFLRLIKKAVTFTGVIKKKSCAISIQGSSFLVLGFLNGEKEFYGISSAGAESTIYFFQKLFFNFLPCLIF